MKINTRLCLLFIVALSVAIFPLPALVQPFRPPIMLLFCLYWQLCLPHPFKIRWLFVAGISLDVLLFTVMGAHTASFLLVSWIAAIKKRQFWFSPPFQQILFISIFCVIYQTALALFEQFNSLHGVTYLVFTQALSGVICWPWVKLLLDRFLGVVESTATN